MAGNCVRSSLIGVNVLFLLAGLAILGLGIWVQVEKGDYVAIADSDTGLTGSALIIAVGAVAVVLSVLGIFGALKRSKCALWLFFSILTIILVIQIIAVILGMVYREKVEDELHADMLKTIKEYGTDAEGVTDAWDWAQQKFECCGVNNYTDWIFSSTVLNKNGSHSIVPDSCCKDEKTGCGDFSKTIKVDVDKTKVYTDGCFNELKEFAKDHLLIIGLSALSFVFLQLIVIALTLILVKSISRSEKVV